VSQPTSEEPTIGAALVAKNRKARGGKKAEQLLSSAEQINKESENQSIDAVPMPIASRRRG